MGPRRVGTGYRQEACTAYGSLRFLSTINDKAGIDKIIQRYNVMLTDTGKALLTTPNHVDNTVVGILPLEIYMLAASDQEKKIAVESEKKLPPSKAIPAASASVGVGRPKALGLKAQATAETEWAAMNMSHQDQMTRWFTIGKGEADNQFAILKDGLSDQTRFWVDDMFMITSIQCQAYRATGNKVYLDRAATEMVAYLDKLQQPNGLFFHADNAHFYWSRGNGWFAVGMAELLSDLPTDHPRRAKILDGYKKMMAGLLKSQAPNGMWRQLIDHEEAWDESSGTGMFTFAFALGVKNGWLPEADYKEPAKKAWTALSSHITADGQVTDVCVGTGAGTSVDYYLKRQKTTGDYHGQAAYVWAAWAMIAPKK